MSKNAYRRKLLVVVIIAVCCMALLIILEFAPNKMTYNTVKEGDNYIVSVNNSKGEMIYKDLYLLEPIILKVGRNTIMVTVGRGDAWNSIFINGKTGEVSDFFQNVSECNEKLVVYATFENGEMKIIIRDIYDKNKTYKKITDAFSKVAVGWYDIKEAKIITNHLVYLNYYVGDDREEKERLIFLN